MRQSMPICDACHAFAKKNMVAHLHAGLYNLQFKAFSFDDVAPVNVKVHVVGCSIGEVTAVTGTACTKCEKGYFSLNPENNTCDMCVENANCSGGAVILPVQGFWHSSPQSLQMHR